MTSSLDTREISSTILCCMALQVLFSSLSTDTKDVENNLSHTVTFSDSKTQSGCAEGKAEEYL